MYVSAELVHPFYDEFLPGPCLEPRDPKIKPSLRMTLIFGSWTIVSWANHDTIIDSKLNFRYISTVEITTDCYGGLVMLHSECKLIFRAVW